MEFETMRGIAIAIQRGAGIALLGLFISTSTFANPVTRSELLATGQGHWILATGGKEANISLVAVGSVTLNVDAKGPAATPGTKVAMLKDAYFNAGPELTAKGEDVTVYLRARDPRGLWRYGLLNKRGNHDVVTFNLFSVEMGGSPVIGFELHSERGFVMIQFPITRIDPVAWHDFVGRYDGKHIELFCDGMLMARKPWHGGKLTQNAEPVLIGAETENGKVVRPFTGCIQAAAVWDTALSDAQIATLCSKSAISRSPDMIEPYVSPIHFRPEMDRLADTIPFYWNGQYHIFYLRSAAKVPWEHIVSRDLVHWTQLPTALVSDGAPDSPDGQNMFTGSVTEKDGVFHIFYTGWNPHNPKGRSFICHATSRDLIHWTKHPQDIIAPDGVHYKNHHDRDFRDAYVFYNKDESKWWMVLCADAVHGSGPGLAVSDDLKTWKQIDPIKARMQECPDLFKIGDMWYLIGGDTYSMSKDPHGPFVDPPFNNVIDRPFIYAGKRMFDGKREVWTGWLWDRNPAEDHGRSQWGGTMCLPRELYVGTRGQLFCKPVDEVVAQFTKTVVDLSGKPSLHLAQAQWSYTDQGLIGKSEAASPCEIDVPDNFMLTTFVRLDRSAVFTVVMHEAPRVADSGYRLILRPHEQQASIAGPGFKYPRHIELDTSHPVKIQCFVQGTMIECFINDAYAFSCRGYNYRTGRLGLRVSGGAVNVQSLTVKVIPDAAGR